MKKKKITIWFLFFLLLCSLIPIPSSTGDEQIWENQYGKLVVEPKTSTNLIRQKQWYNATWYYPANTLDIAFRFNESLSYGKIFYWNGVNYVKLNPNHVIYNDKHYYTLNNINFGQNETKHGYWEFDVLPQSKGKWDMFIKLSSDTWQTAFQQNRYIHLDPWWDSNWDYKKEITIDHNQVVTDLPNFPVLINLSSDTDLASDAQNDGDDICFTESTETTQLNHNLEFFDGTTGELAVWVNVTSLDADADTSIWMYYGNSGCSSQENEVGTWDSDYVAVYHQNNSNADSTINRYNLSKFGDANPTTSGYIKGGTVFGGAGHLYETSFLDFEATSQTEFSIEAWWYINPSDTYKNVGIHINDGATSDQGIYTIHGDTPYDWTVLLKNAATQVSKVAGDFESDRWYYIVSTGDDSNGVTLYIDSHNESEASGTVSFTGFPSNDLYIGWNRKIDRYYRGRFDEIRISKIKRNESWITTSYNTMSNASDGNFFTLGIEYTSIAPEPPTDFVATTENDNINVSWILGINATSTYLERNTIGAWNRGEGTFLYNDSGTYYVDASSLSCATIYYYRGWSYNSTSNNFSTSNVSNNITCPGDPTNVQSTLYDSYLNITWNIGTYADKTIIVRKSGSSPSSPYDGTEVYNGTGSSHNDSGVNASHYHRIYSWNESTNTFSAGANVLHGSFYINVYDENTSDAITCWDIFISNEEGTQTYESTCNNNTLILNVADVPYGNNTVIKINATGYNFQFYYMDLEIDQVYTLNAYLSYKNATEQYIITVAGPQTEYGYDPPIEDAKISFRRFINETVGYQNVSILITSATGTVSINLIPQESYLLIISKSGYTTEYIVFTPPPITHEINRYHTFRLLLEGATIPFDETVKTNISYTFYPVGTRHTGVFTFWFNISSSDGKLEWYRMTVMYYNDTTDKWVQLDTQNESNAYGGDLDYTIPNVTGKYSFECYYKKQGFDEYTISETGSLIHFYVKVREALETFPDYAWYIIIIIVMIVAMGLCIRYFATGITTGYIGLIIMAVMLLMKDVTIPLGGAGGTISGWAIWGITFLIYSMGVFLWSRI